MSGQGKRVVDGNVGDQYWVPRAYQGNWGNCIRNGANGRPGCVLMPPPGAEISTLPPRRLHDLVRRPNHNNQ